MTDNDKFVCSELIEAIKAFPVQREINHCGSTFFVSPFEFYAVCPDCETKLKVRSFSGATELEDVFDAVFKWLNQPQAKGHFQNRLKEIIEDSD